MIAWLKRLFCRHAWNHEREGFVRTWTCRRCGKVKTYTDLPIPPWPRPPASPRVVTFDVLPPFAGKGLAADEPIPLSECRLPIQTRTASDGVQQDAERYRWLTTDHDNGETRARCREILGRMPMMSYSAASAAIDTARKETKS